MENINNIESEIGLPMQKAIKDKRVSDAFLEAVRIAPFMYRKAMEMKIVRGEFKTLGAAVEVALALNRNPERAASILEPNYSKLKTTDEVIKVVTKYSPYDKNQVLEGFEAGDELVVITKSLAEWLHSNPRATIPPIDALRIFVGLAALDSSIQKWGAAIPKFSDIKQLEK